MTTSEPPRHHRLSAGSIRSKLDKTIDRLRMASKVAKSVPVPSGIAQSAPPRNPSASGGHDRGASRDGSDPGAALPAAHAQGKGLSSHDFRLVRTLGTGSRNPEILFGLGLAPITHRLTTWRVRHLRPGMSRQGYRCPTRQLGLCLCPQNSSQDRRYGAAFRRAHGPRLKGDERRFITY